MPASPAAQRLVLHKVLSLPAPVLRLMSGGGVVYQGGRTLDPRLQSAAKVALQNGLESYDRRHGWRGAWGKVTTTAWGWAGATCCGSSISSSPSGDRPWCRVRSLRR